MRLRFRPIHAPSTPFDVPSYASFIQVRSAELVSKLNRLPLTPPSTALAARASRRSRGPGQRHRRRTGRATHPAHRRGPPHPGQHRRDRPGDPVRPLPGRRRRASVSASFHRITRSRPASAMSSSRVISEDTLLAPRFGSTGRSSTPRAHAHSRRPILPYRAASSSSPMPASSPIRVMPSHALRPNQNRCPLLDLAAASVRLDRRRQLAAMPLLRTCRGRNAGHPAPPAQIPACALTHGAPTSGV